MPTWFERLLDRALKIRPGEAPKVGLMALYAANAIGAVVVGRIVRDALFLADRTKNDLPAMYILNSVGVALLSWGYSHVADKLRRDRLNAIVSAGWALVMALFFFAALAAPRAASPALYVAVEAMGALVVMQFWTFAQDVFTTREAKRLFPLISAGGQAANVIYGFLAATVSRSFGAESLLWLCAANLVACAGLAWFIGRRHPPVPPSREVAHRPDRAGGRSARPAATGGTRALATPHLVTIAAIAVLSAVAVNLVDFQFKAAAEQSFANKAELGAFFGRFYAVCGAVALTIQMGITGRVLERFGILASLLPLPIGLVVGSVAAAAFPGGLAASFAKGSDSIFRYTLNDASMQLLYLPVPAHQRGKAKALIDGILRPAAGVLAGLILMSLGHAALGGRILGRPDSITTALILLLVGGWVWLIVRGRREYVHSLLDTLQRRRLDLVSQPMNADQATADALVKVLHSNDALAILHALELLPHVQGRDFGPAVSGLLDHPVSSIRSAAADFLAEHADARFAAKLRERLGDRDPWCVASAIGALCAVEREAALPLVRPFLTDPRPAIRASAVVGLVRHAGINGILEAADELKKLLNATTPVERELAASVLGALGVPTFYDALLGFLRDGNPSVRRAAMVAAGRLRSPELVPHLIRLLSHRNTAREAAGALAAFGAGIEKALGDAMADAGFDLDARRAVPAVLGRLATREAAERLQLALESSDPPLRAAAAKALARLARRRTDVVVRRETVIRAIKNELELAESLARVQSALGLPNVDRQAPVRIPRGRGSGVLLALALLEERDRAVERTLVLLELLHPNAGLDVVADNLRSEQPARRANAVEVLDNTVREDVKKRLLPLIENREPLRSAEPNRTRVEHLSQLVTGSHAWIAACAAQLAAEEHLTGLVGALEAGLASAIPYVREACASALGRISPASARPALERLREDPARSVRRVAESALVLSRLATA
jgi:ATP/ADP translocase/HEAT repeat protein